LLELDRLKVCARPVDIQLARRCGVRNARADKSGVCHE
jgi:hypothetical protein